MVESSNNFNNTTSSLSQSVSSNTHLQIQSLIKFIPNSALGYPQARNPYNANFDNAEGSRDNKQGMTTTIIDMNRKASWVDAMTRIQLACVLQIR